MACYFGEVLPTGLVAWELLLFILLLEATFGLAGLISAPIIYAQIKRILVDRNWVV